MLEYILSEMKVEDECVFFVLYFWRVFCEVVVNVLYYWGYEYEYVDFVKICIYLSYIDIISYFGLY